MCDTCQKASDMRPCFVFFILLNLLILYSNILYKRIKEQNPARSQFYTYTHIHTHTEKNCRE